MKLKGATINRREIWRELCHCWGNGDHRYVHTHMMIVYKSYICAMQIVHSKSYGSCWIVIECSGTGSVIGCHGMSWSPRLMRREETTIELTVTDRWGGCPVCVYVVPVEPTMAVVYYSLAELMSLVPLVACIRLQGLQSPSECDPGLFTELVFMLLHSLYWEQVWK